MIKFVFGDGAAGSLKCAMCSGDYTPSGVHIALDEEGQIISEKPYAPEPYTELKLQGFAEDLLGCALAHSPADVSDWWYAQRVRRMFGTGKLVMIRENERFYYSAVKRAGCL